MSASDFLDPELLEILLTEEKSGLICEVCRLKYPN